MTVGEDRGQLVVDVTLSQRNLLTLLHKLDLPGSARTLKTDSNVPAGCRLRVRAEDDRKHYQQRGWPPPGVMHPATEAFISEAEDDTHA